MSHFLEAVASLLPSNAGGRTNSVSPRAGSYRPFAMSGQSRLRIRIIEGPPQLEPGEAARVVAEVESGRIDALGPGAELDLVELGDAPVGILTVLRVIVLALFFVACSSSDAIKTEKRTFEGGPGQPIEVELVGASQPMMMFARGGEMPQQINFQFLVSNNSDEVLTVKRIAVYQHGAAPVQLESAQGGFDTSIDPGRDHTFTVNATAKQTRPARQGDEASIIIRADVALTNGDSYVYTFEIPIGLAVQ